MIPSIAALLFALALSALVHIAELAIFSLDADRIGTLVEEGYRKSKVLARLADSPRRVLALARTLTTLGDAIAAAAAAFIGFQVVGVPGLIAGLIVGFLLVLFVTRMLPMLLLKNHAIRVALAAATPFSLLDRGLGPVVGGLAAMVRTLPAAPRRKGPLTESEWRQMTAIGRTEGVVGEHERQLIERAFRLDETKAWDIMTPRVDIFAWPDAVSLATIADEFHTVPYSRVPIYDGDESIDQVTGVLYLRDAYQALVSGQRDVPLYQLARQPLIVPGSVSLTRLLQDFQTRRIHLAIVVDEYGGTDGLVTLEDVLEELVGEIVDETDVAREAILRVSRNEIVAQGDADLREINHIFNTAFPLVEHRSLNGYLLDELGRVPETGEKVDRDGVGIEVLDASETQVVRARLRRLPARTEEMDGRPAADGGRPKQAKESGAAESEPEAETEAESRPQARSSAG